MWDGITRLQYRREGLRYASDTTDEEWALIEPFMPPPSCGRGRPRTTDLRAVVNAIFYMAQTGCQWRMLPKDFPPFTTVQRYFYPWRDAEVWRTINHTFAAQAREAEGREASPSAGIIDSQSAKTTEAGGPRGYDAGKKVKGRKRHILTDTMGMLVGAIVHTADIQDRDGAPLLLASVRDALPWLRHVFADAAYAGDKLEQALATLGTWTLEIVKRADDAKGFVLLPRRWVVERTIAWLNRNRRLAKDFEATIESALAWIFIANVKLLSRRLARNDADRQLTSQTLRHALNQGPITTLLKKLASSSSFLGGTDRAVDARRMGDQELILRSLSFLYFGWKSYQEYAELDK